MYVFVILNINTYSNFSIHVCSPDLPLFLCFLHQADGGGITAESILVVLSSVERGDRDFCAVHCRGGLACCRRDPMSECVHSNLAGPVSDIVHEK